MLFSFFGYLSRPFRNRSLVYRLLPSSSTFLVGYFLYRIISNFVSSAMNLTTHLIRRSRNLIHYTALLLTKAFSQIIACRNAVLSFLVYEHYRFLLVRLIQLLWYTNKSTVGKVDCKSKYHVMVDGFVLFIVVLFLISIIIIILKMQLKSK